MGLSVEYICQNFIPPSPAEKGDMFSISQEDLNQRAIENFQKLVAPCEKMRQLVRDGRFEEAIYSHEGPCYGIDYAIALENLGDQEVPYLGETYKASKLFKMLREEYAFCTLTSNTCWEALPKKRQEMRQKSSSSPSEAIDFFYNTPCFMECNTALEVAHLKTICDALGEDKFNRISEVVAPLSIGNKDFSTYIPSIYDAILNFKTAKSTNDFFTEMFPGSCSYIYNVAEFSQRHFIGPEIGHYIMKVSDAPTFCAFGFPSAGIEIDEVIRDHLIAPLRKPPIDHYKFIPLEARYFDLVNPVDNKISRFRATELKKIAKAKPQIAPYITTIIRNAKEKRMRACQKRSLIPLPSDEEIMQNVRLISKIRFLDANKLDLFLKAESDSEIEMAFFKNYAPIKVSTETIKDSERWQALRKSLSPPCLIELDRRLQR